MHGGGCVQRDEDGDGDGDRNRDGDGDGDGIVKIPNQLFLLRR